MGDRVMSSESALKLANSLFVDESYQEALNNYNLSIELDDQNVEALLKRAACLQKLGKLTDALADINAAIKLNPDNSTLSKAYLRKGMICFDMEEFETAKSSLEKGQQIDSNNTQFRTWIRKCNAELEIEEESSGNISAPVVDNNSNKQAKTETTTSPSNSSSTSSSSSSNTSSNNNNNNSSAPKPYEPPKIRHEWFQTNTHVLVSVYAKNVKKEQAKIEFEEKSLTVEIKLSDTNQFVLDVELFDKIVPSESTFTIMGTKVEIKLKKLNQIRWKTLEDTGDNTTVNSVQQPSESSTTKPTTTGPPKTKNWDKIVKDVTGDEKLDGEESLNKVFQDIYGNGTDEQKRAMMKSFLESGGTVLSTNWDEVGKGEVKGSPPDGLEMHKWSDLEKN